MRRFVQTPQFPGIGATPQHKLGLPFWRAYKTKVFARISKVARISDRTPPTRRSYYEHNNLWKALCNDEKSEGWAAAETGPAKTDPEAPIVADECRIQGVKRIRNAAEFDGE
jgi:hypothetical protein